MIARRRVGRGGERGTAVLELALVLPLLVLLVFGTLDVGRAIYIKNALANAARDGARFASVDPTNSACIQTVAAQRSSLANLGAADVTITRGSVDLGQPITVAVQSTYTPITPLVGSLIGSSSLTLRSSATMEIRSVPANPLSCPTLATATATPFVPTATATAAVPTETPTALPIGTSTPPATGTPLAPTATSAPPTATAVAPTGTPAPPTATAVTPTASPTACVGAPGQCKKG